MVDSIKKKDQIELLEACMKNNDFGTPMNLFTYPNCGSDLVAQGLVTKKGEITIAGRCALWFLGNGEDPTNSKSSITTTISLNRDSTK